MPEWTAPADGWLTVSVGGTRITRVHVEADEEILVDLTVDKPPEV